MLNKDKDGPERKHKFHYRSVVGMLSYLDKTTRPYFKIAVHQCARFYNDPRLSHDRAFLVIEKHFLGTKDKVVVYKPDSNRGLECFFDADFAGGWVQCDAEDVTSLFSRSGIVIFYAG